MYILALITAAIVIVAAGTALARSGERIADITGIGQVWFGAIFVALATSLPELTTDVTAVLRDQPALAIGDLFGSNMANMAILGLIGVAMPAARIFAREALELTVTGSVAVVLTAIAALFVVANLDHSIAGSFSYGSVALAAVGVAALALLPGYSLRLAEGALPEERAPRPQRRWPSRVLLVTFASSALAILVAGPVLAASADELVERTGLDATFVGVIVLAVATSLPELATSVAAVRAGALDLAVSNLFGSNATNMMLLVFLDLVYVQRPLLETAGMSAGAAGLIAILLMMTGLIAMALRAERGRFGVELAGVVMIATYVSGLGLVYSVGDV